MDDDDDIREIVAEVLSGEGYSVVVARDGREALQRLDEMASPPCLVLLDLAMPRIDGWEFLSELKARPSHVHTPVVVCTASGRTRPAGLEAVGWLSKPMDRDRLVATVALCCGPTPSTADESDPIPRRRASFLRRRGEEIATMREALASDDYSELIRLGHNLAHVGRPGATNDADPRFLEPESVPRSSLRPLPATRPKGHAMRLRCRGSLGRKAAPLSLVSYAARR